MAAPPRYHVYILECSDGSLYVGSTHDLTSRVAAHNAGRGAAWTATRRPVRLVWHEEHESETAAVKRENKIKRWSRLKKAALIARDWKQLKRLSHCRAP